jgi:hypothetical protein
MAGSDETLAIALRRNVYGTTPPSPDALRKLTRYVRCAHDALAAQKIDAILGGVLSFPVVISS